jgi:Domain of unknown function (DUF5916)
MGDWLRRAGLALCMVAVFSALSRAADNTAVVGDYANPRMEALRAKGPIVLDGRLNEADWARAVPVTLTQQSPAPGAETPYVTTVRALILHNNLYFGFEAADPEPDKIAVHTKRRDGNTFGDDTVALVIDSYGDRRTGFFFRTNAAGARIDGLVAGPQDFSSDWNGIWDVRTSVHKGGWSAEFMIPAQSLTFTPGLEAWGVNFERRIARDQIRLRWTSPTLNSFFFDLSRAGDLAGTGELAQGLGVEISPYVTGRTTKQFAADQRNFTGQPGMDMTWRLTPQMAAVFTVNTDFAETAVDSRQLNVTRFPLFFPEKRGFFLEGANQYNFGLGLGGNGGPNNFIPFFSRRIGIYGDQLAPINAGLKLNGRLGRWNLGMLDVQTRDSQFAPGTNMFAGRASFDVTPKWRVGTLVTHGDPSGVESNTLLGFDTVWRTPSFRGNKNLLLGAWFALSAGDIPEGSRTGWGIRLDYPNDRWDCRSHTFQFGDALDPALGYLRRPGTRQYNAGCSFRPRPARDGRWSFIRQRFHSVSYNRADNIVSGQTESWSLNLNPMDIEFDSGERIEFRIRPGGEQLLEPFEISDGVVLPVGQYHYVRYRLDGRTASQRPVVVSGRAEFGSFYNGHLLQTQAEVNWTSTTGTISTGLTAEQNYGTLLQGKFVQRLWQLNFTYAFDPNLVLTSFAQYDNESQSVGNNMRLRWTLKPGNDVFVVWNRGWTRLILGPSERGLVPDSDLVAVKLRWTFRK